MCNTSMHFGIQTLKPGWLGLWLVLAKHLLGVFDIEMVLGGLLHTNL
jgi:hypothetical protein